MNTYRLTLSNGVVTFVRSDSTIFQVPGIAPDVDVIRAELITGV